MELTLENLEKLMQFRPTLNETAIYFKVSPDTIERKIRKWKRCTFLQFKEINSLGLKQRLRDKAVDLALNGNATMMIFCLKNLCGWADRIESKESDRGPIIMIGPNDDRSKYPENASVIRMAYDPNNLRPPPEEG